VFQRPLAALLAALALFLAGCGDESESAEPAQQPTSSAAVETTAAAEFPVTVEADNGSVTIEEEPDAIVSLSSTATESLFAIGAGEQVLAVDDQSNYPADAPVTDLSGFEPNVEAIAGYEPDLVIAAYDPGGLVEGLEKLDIPVLLQDAAPDLAVAYEQIGTLGVATGNVEGAETLVTSMQVAIDELVASVPGAEGATVYHELGPDFFSATSDTFIGSIYELFGLVNIADGAAGAADAGGYPQLTGEYIVSESPDLIVLSDTKCCQQTAEKVANRPGWNGITAVKNGTIVEADDDIASRWGPRTVEFVDLVAQSLEGVGSR
jgi:iron complex transport system substrate-binding protein